MGNPLNDAAMKKLFYIFALVAAAVALSSCVKEMQESFSGPEVTVSFTAGAPQTRTAFTEPDGNTYPVLWTENDRKVALSLNYANIVKADVAPAADFKTASFTATFAEATAPFTFYLMSPASAAINISKDYKDWTVDVPTLQTPLEKSVDEAAQILVAKSEAFSEIPQKVTFSLDHWTAYGKLTLANLALDGAEIESVDLTAETPWAGRWYYYPDTGEAKANPGAETITINTKATADLWFACAPVELSGKKLTVAVKTDRGIYTKEITLPAERKFESGKIARFTVDMAGVKPVAPKEYVLVKDVAELTLGGKYIIAAVEANMAVSTTQNGNNRPETAVVKDGDKVVGPGTSVEVFELEAGTVEGTYALKATGHAGYLYTVKGSNYLRTKDEKSAEGDWVISISEGVATIKVIYGDEDRFLKHNVSSKLFSAYKSGQKDVALYKLAEGPAPAKQLTLERVWGLYTTADGLWCKDVTAGGTAITHPDGYGMVRSIAMDDDYIYLPKSSAYAAVLAIKRDDPTQVIKLNVSGLKGSTFASSFVRMIKNSDPAVNGGKDVLLVCNLTSTDSDENQLRLFAYKNGIDAAPVQIAGFCWDSANNTNDWRRYGDRFFVTGTWQEGKVYFPSFNASKSVILSIANGARTAVQQIWSASSPDGIKDMTVYPGGSNLLITNTSTGNFIAPTGDKQNGWDKFDLVSASEKAVKTFGYNFFSFNDKKYIACARLIDEGHGCLQIFEDQGTEASFLASIDAQSGLMQAPVQHATDMAAAAGSSTLADCSVRIIGDEVYIATLTQNGGLVVDKLYMK